MAAQPPHKPAHRTIKTALFAGAAMLACAAASGTAWAGQITGTALLNTPSANSGISSITGNKLGTITLSPNGLDEVDMTVTLNSTNDYNVLFIKSGSTNSHTPFAFNLKSSKTTGTSISMITPSSFANFQPSQSSYINTPFGSFDFGIDYTAGNGTSHGNPGPLTFSVTNSNGIGINDFTTNSDGYIFTADLSVKDLTVNPNITKTGIVASNSITTSGGGGNPVGSSVPEPGSLVLLGTGLVGLGFAARRKRHRA